MCVCGKCLFPSPIDLHAVIFPNDTSVPDIGEQRYLLDELWACLGSSVTAASPTETPFGDPIRFLTRTIQLLSPLLVCSSAIESLTWC